MIGLIEDSYRDIGTTITQRSWQVSMSIRRGVKQGDPLTLFIFNAVLEPLLLQLEEMQGFEISDGVKVSSFAFADDIIIVSSTAPGAENLLRNTGQYLGGLGMSISAQKCTAFNVKYTRESLHLLDPGLSSANGEEIPFAGAATALHYLGGTFHPGRGLQQTNWTASSAIRWRWSKGYR